MRHHAYAHHLRQMIFHAINVDCSMPDYTFIFYYAHAERRCCRFHLFYIFFFFIYSFFRALRAMSDAPQEMRCALFLRMYATMIIAMRARSAMLWRARRVAAAWQVLL